MKKIVFAAFIAFWACVGTMVALQAMAPDHKVTDSDELTGYTLAEIAEHNTLEDCWMAIEGKVYDFSDYIPQHPTPPSVMQPWCGQEATEGMRTKGYGRDHSPAAWAMMEPYLIGELVD
jgi:cytochrome b involved in lipid metabolism